MSDEHTEGSSAEIASESATPSVSISSLETDLKSCGIKDDFILDVGLGVRPVMELDGKPSLLPR